MRDDDIYIAAIPPPGKYFTAVERAYNQAALPERETVIVPEPTRDLEIELIPAKREDTRRQLALCLLALIAILSCLIVFSAIAGLITVADAKELAGSVLPPLTSILAIMIGFFFGEAKKTV